MNRTIPLILLALAALASQASEPLFLQWGTINTDAPAAQVESAALKTKLATKAAAIRRTAAAETRAAYLVQFSAAVTEAQRSWLEAATQVRGYIPENAYLVWATPSEMDAITASPDVFWTGEWKKEYKTVRVPAAKRAAAAAEADTARWMRVVSLMTDDEGAARLRARLEALPAPVRSAFPRLGGSSAVAFLTAAQIDEVASWPDVDWIEPKLQPRLLSDKAVLTNMMNVTPAWKAISAGGLGLTGAGQVVAVADTGCDKGSTSDIHADFVGRIKAGYGWTNGVYQSSASWADYDAHGTHVGGCILGSGAQSNGQFRGVAYEAQLVVQGCQEDLGGLPDDINDLFNQAYSQGARIHSNSWGWGVDEAGQYIYDAANADEYMWTNQNFLVLFAAGNDGIDKNRDGVIDPGSVIPPATSKNCLGVGASENYRSTGGYADYTWGGTWGRDFPAAPISGDKISGTATPQGIAAFSGRGPTADGRIKPDIVAPGTDIISVRSRVAKGDGWGIYNDHYLYEGGTSMATPLVAGTIALIRQWLVDRQGIAEPPAALMKALLINGARDMSPGQYGTGSTQEITARPDRSQGFGHVNLYNALEPGDGNFLVFATNNFTTTGANFTTNIVVGKANAGKYILTLAWQDYPGESGAAKTLVNDLDLTVTSPSGTVYYPNNYGTLDHTNNVEFIEFTAPEVGSYTVNVNAYQINMTTGVGSQPFALVMRGPETPSRWLRGSGTAEDPFQIADRSDLEFFRDQVNNANALGTAGQHFVQLADIDLGGDRWIEIGNINDASAYFVASPMFSGVYDGGGHVVSNFVLSGYGYCGFFGAIIDGTVKNLQILDALSPIAMSSGAVFCGDLEGTSLIENVTVSGNVWGNHNIGGFSSRCEGDITMLSCTNLANVGTTFTKLGGFHAYYGNTYTLFCSNCCNKGTLTFDKVQRGNSTDATAAVGGFVGFQQNAGKTVFVDCVNEGAINATYTSGSVGVATLGGFVGRANQSGITLAITNGVSTGAISANFANVNEQAEVGGFVGRMVKGVSLSMHNATVTAGTTMSATVQESVTPYVRAFVGRDLNSPQTAVLTRGVAPSEYEPGIASGIAGGYDSTSTENGMTTYFIEFSVDWDTDADASLIWGTTAPTAAELESIKSWATTNNIADPNGKLGVASYLLGCTSRLNVYPILQIDALRQVDTGWEISMCASAGKAVVPLSAAINGTLKVRYASSLDGAWTEATYAPTFANGQATVTVTAEGAHFIKAAVTR